MLKGKTAIVYGAAGAVGGAVARAFADEGAHVFLTGRTLASVDAAARDIVAAGGAAEAAQVDALDERAVDEHIAAVVAKIGYPASWQPPCPGPEPWTLGDRIQRLGDAADLGC